MAKQSRKKKVNNSARLPLYVTRRFFPKRKSAERRKKVSKKVRKIRQRKPEKVNEIRDSSKIRDYIYICLDQASEFERIVIALNKVKNDLDQKIFDDEDGKPYFEWGNDKFSRKFGDTYYQSSSFLAIYRDALNRSLRRFDQLKEILTSIATHPTSIHLPINETARGASLKISTATLIMLFNDSLEDAIIIDETGWATNRGEETAKALWEFAVSTAKEFLKSIIGEEVCSALGGAPKMLDAVNASKTFTKNKNKKTKARKI